MQENFINHILDILPNPIITAVIGFFTLYLTRKYNYKTIARERLDHVYHPLFLEIEPFLFKNVTYTDIQHIVDKYMELEKDYSLLISPTLRYLMHSIYEKKEVHKADKFYPDDWIVVCKQFSKEYDKLCKYALIPTRNTAYRLEKKQYASKTKFLLVQFVFSIPSLLSISLIFALISPDLFFYFWIIVLYFLVDKMI